MKIRAYDKEGSQAVAVDVGGGGQGGSPNNPVFLGSYAYPSGWNHAAFPYWSESAGKFYLFAGDEAGRRGNTPGYEGEAQRMNGWIHVVEWDEWGKPHEVARYEVPEVGTHNLWVEDDIMYVAYYQGGLRVVDVSGELLGEREARGFFKLHDWVVIEPSTSDTSYGPATTPEVASGNEAIVRRSATAINSRSQSRRLSWHPSQDANLKTARRLYGKPLLSSSSCCPTRMM